MEKLEIELKWKVLDRKKLFCALNKLSREKRNGYDYNPQQQINIWYSRAQKPKSALRLRISRPFPHARSNGYTYCITKKGPNKDTKFKACLEDNFYAINFDSPQKAIEFFSFAGFIEQFRYERIRTDFHINNVVISHDILPIIGEYIEIEGSRENILETAAMLGLSENDASNLSYKEIFNLWKAQNPNSYEADMVWEGDKGFFSKK